MPVRVPSVITPAILGGRCVRLVMFVATAWLAGAGTVVAGGVTAPLTVPTYHGDMQRTGWNASETVLSPATVNSKSFGQLGVVPLDGQVDAQPLYIEGQAIAGGRHNVVYVATEANSI